MIKNMKSKMITNSQLSTTEPKKKTKNKLSEQLEQEYNHRNGDHMEGYQRGRGGRMGEKVQRISSINYRQEKKQGEVKNKKWRSQRTYMYDPWT